MIDLIGLSCAVQLRFWGWWLRVVTALIRTGAMTPSCLFQNPFCTVYQHWVNHVLKQLLRRNGRISWDLYFEVIAPVSTPKLTSLLNIKELSWHLSEPDFNLSTEKFCNCVSLRTQAVSLHPHLVWSYMRDSPSSLNLNMECRIWFSYFFSPIFFFREIGNILHLTKVLLVQAIINLLWKWFSCKETLPPISQR